MQVDSHCRGSDGSYLLKLLTDMRLLAEM